MPEKPPGPKRVRNASRQDISKSLSKPRILRTNTCNLLAEPRSTLNSRLQRFLVLHSHEPFLADEKRWNPLYTSLVGMAKRFSMGLAVLLRSQGFGKLFLVQTNLTCQIG